ncbi:hypothetical protein [Fastidiosipila sanguinis]|uniref:Uncharacterized protein n=1 Tax=Fastidiosipila sanguinis TaxID=236753 RepID=A0A2S0KQ36_9FIRM|nr:hypothetical protein [Fastidiosipila sanguinis]AVM43150.1 hypothetical protein C5Q98_06115 [Fastidiosipila sanguinis]
MAEEKKRKAVYNREADKRWRDKNKEHAGYLRDRTSARRFLKKKATEDDLLEMEELITERRKELAEMEEMNRII